MNPTIKACDRLCRALLDGSTMIATARSTETGPLDSSTVNSALTDWWYLWSTVARRLLSPKECLSYREVALFDRSRYPKGSRIRRDDFDAIRCAVAGVHAAITSTYRSRFVAHSGPGSARGATAQLGMIHVTLTRRKDSLDWGQCHVISCPALIDMLENDAFATTVLMQRCKSHPSDEVFIKKFCGVYSAIKASDANSVFRLLGHDDPENLVAHVPFSLVQVDLEPILSPSPVADALASAPPVLPDPRPVSPFMDAPSSTALQDVSAAIQEQYHAAQDQFGKSYGYLELGYEVFGDERETLYPRPSSQPLPIEAALYGDSGFSR